MNVKTGKTKGGKTDGKERGTRRKEPFRVRRGEVGRGSVWVAPKSLHPVSETRPLLTRERGGVGKDRYRRG